MSVKRSTIRRSEGQGEAATSRDSLANEREFLQRSIEDLERELESGEVEEGDFAVLRSRYGGRLLEVERALSALAADRPEAEPAEAVTRPDRLGTPLRRRLGGRRARVMMGTGAGVCFLVAAGLLAVSLAGGRLPGESDTGSVSLSSAQQVQETLARAAILGSEGQIAEAVQQYGLVLQADPGQPEALTYQGWLIRLTGLSSRNKLVLARGDASLARAVKVAPGYPDGHALLGVALYEDYGNPSAACVQFRRALGAGASKNLISSVAAVAVKAFAAANEPLPRRYAAAVKAARSGG